MNTFPFTILALAPFYSVGESASSAEIISTDLTSLGEAITKIGATLSIPVPKELCPTGVLSFQPSGLKDLKPQGMVKRIPYLKRLLDAGKFVESALSEGASQEQIIQCISQDWQDLPLDLSIPSRQPSDQRKQDSVADDILSMVAMPGSSTKKETPGGARGLQNQLDNLISRLLEIVYADDVFRNMESAWRGVETIVRQGPVKERDRVILNLAPVSQSSLPERLKRLITQLSEDLPNLILIDLPFDNSAPSIELMEKVADFASTLMVPTVIWIGPRFFHLDSWSALSKLPYLKHHLEDMGYAKWRKLKGQPVSDWLVITTDRFLTRIPYGEANPPRTVYFKEKEPLWISPVWAIGTLIAQSVMKYGWPTRFTDYRNISISDLAVVYTGDQKAVSTEAILSEDRVMQFVEAGIIPLAGAVGKDFAFMPKETILSGGSLKFQLFFNHIIGYLFKLKDQIGEAAGSEDLGSKLISALADLFRNTGHEPPTDLSVEAGQAEEGKSIPLKIAFSTPKSILSASEKLEFTLAW